MEPRGLFGLAGNGLENVDVNKSPPWVPFLQAAPSPASRRTARPAALQIHYSCGMGICGAAHISFPVDRNPLQSEKLRDWGSASWCGYIARSFSLSSSSKLSFYDHIRAQAITELVKKMILSANITQFLIFPLWLWVKKKELETKRVTNSAFFFSSGGLLHKDNPGEHVLLKTLVESAPLMNGTWKSFCNGKTINSLL